MDEQNPPQEDDSDPISHLDKLLKTAQKAFSEFWVVLRALLIFAPAAAYFGIYWPIKENMRTLLRIGAVGFLSASSFLLILEIGFELMGAQTIIAWFKSINAPHKALLAEGGFVIAAGILLAHHWKEVVHVKTEHILANAIWAILEIRGAKTEEEFIRAALPFIAGAFRKFSIKHVCLWYPNDEEFHLPEGCAYPNDKTMTLTSLPLSEGIAYHVYDDQLIRYVPRFGFPFNKGPFAHKFWSFPHALTFQTTIDENSLPEVDRPGLSINKVKLEDEWWKKPTRAFAVVPLRTIAKECIGVMSVDFKKTDPIGREQLKVIASLAVLVTEEITRLRKIEVPENQDLPN